MVAARYWGGGSTVSRAGPSDARYFQTKRKLASPDKIKKYTADDSVAVLSIAMGKDLFPWFQSLGVTVKKENAQIEIKKLTADPQTP